MGDERAGGNVATDESTALSSDLPAHFELNPPVGLYIVQACASRPDFRVGKVRVTLFPSAEWRVEQCEHVIRKPDRPKPYCMYLT